MRKIFTVIFLLLCLQNVVCAQQIEVLGVDEDLSDLAASVHRRKDGNGDPCALVKVMLPVEDAKFDGYIVGDVRYDTGVYWVYMTAESKKLVIKHPQYAATTLDFTKYNINGVQALRTYIVRIKAGESQKKQTLTISFSPSNASVIIDGKMYPSDNGKVTGMFPVGRHEVIIAAVGYESYEGSVTLRESSPSNIQTTLIKSAFVDIPHSIEQNNNVTNVSSSTSMKEQTVNTYSANSQYILDKLEEGKRLYDNKDYTPAYKCFKMAAEAGNAKAQYNLGLCYMDGKGIPQNSFEGAKWYLKSAEQGNTKAQCDLGACYALGNGVKQDYMVAVEWYRMAAEQGYAMAQSNLGFCYLKGNGVSQNYREAASWYKKAAEQGYANAQYGLGICYEIGQGVAKDIKEATKWYHKAAEQGNKYAQFHLGELGVTLQVIVADENGEYFVGASLCHKKGDKDIEMKITNSEGYASFDDFYSGDTLVVSYIGYVVEKITFNVFPLDVLNGGTYVVILKKGEGTGITVHNEDFVTLQQSTKI